MSQDRPKLTSGEKDKVQQFMAITECSEARAMQYMLMFNWNLEQAVEDVFVNPPPTEENIPTVSRDVILDLFTNYATAFPKEYDSDSDDEEITHVHGDRMRDFFVDLGYDPSTDIGTFILSWQLKCEKLAMISRKEWVEGFYLLKCATIEDIKKKIEELRTELADNEDQFKNFYRYVFVLARGTETYKQSIDKKTAIALWTLLLTNKFPLLQDWIEFIDNKGQAVSADCWNLLLDFSFKHGSPDKINSFDSMDFWPNIIDDFVDWWNTNKKK